MLNYLTNVWQVLAELAPWLFLGLGAAGLLHILVPRDFVVRHLGSSGFGSVVKAVLLGVPMPLCSCGVIPAALGIKKQGASDGAAIGFLISTPQTGIDSIFVSGSLLGWPFALFKVFSAAVTGLLGGFITQAATGREPATPTGSPATADGTPQPRGLRAMLSFAVNELLYTIWYWLALGVLVSAAISTWVPKDFLQHAWYAQGLTAMLLMLLISLPLYVCATSSVPIAAALVHAGMPTGAALVFLMAGPASNVATLGAVYRGFGAKVLTIYLATISVCSIVFGYLFGFILSGPAPGTQVMAHEHGPGLIGNLAAGVLVAAMLWFAARDLRLKLRTFRKKAAAVEEKAEFKVSGMTCEGCAGRVRQALLALADVSQVDIDLPTGRVTVKGKDLLRKQLAQTIVKTGYGVES